MDATADIYGKLAGEAFMRALEAFLNGERWAVEAYEKWKATGEAPTLVIKSLEEHAPRNEH